MKITCHVVMVVAQIALPAPAQLYFMWWLTGLASRPRPAGASLEVHHPRHNVVISTVLSAALSAPWKLLCRRLLRTLCTHCKPCQQVGTPDAHVPAQVTAPT
jgi:hypothetical protein